MFRVDRRLLLIHTLASCFAANAFKVTELVTDSRGLEIADRLGWKYTNYQNAFDDLAPEGMTHIWALGKLTALTLQHEPFCHLDNDVLLYSPLPTRMKTARLIAQSKDIPSFYKGPDMEAALVRSGFPKHGAAYNVGLIGGADVELVRRYANSALTAAKRFEGCEINGTTTSMVLEQYYLGVFAREHRVPIEEMIPIPTHCTDDDYQTAQYVHLAGDCKYKTEWLDRCEKLLREKFPDAYRRFEEGWKVLG